MYYFVTPWKCIVRYELWEMCIILFGSNSLKMSVLFYMNSDKKFVVLFYINSLKVSELFDMNFKIMQLLFCKSCILKNLVETEVFYNYYKEYYP